MFLTGDLRVKVGSFTLLVGVIALATLVGVSPAPAAGARTAQAQTLDCGKVVDAVPDQFPAWSDAAGWDDPSRYRTIQLADIDGDRKAELMARGPSGMITSRFDADSAQWIALNSNGPFGPSWEPPEY